LLVEYLKYFYRLERAGFSHLQELVPAQALLNNLQKLILSLAKAVQCFQRKQSVEAIIILGWDLDAIACQKSCSACCWAER